MWKKILFASCAVVMCTRHRVTLQYNGQSMVFEYADGRNLAFNHKDKQKELVSQMLEVPKEHVFISPDNIITISDIFDVVSDKLLSRWTRCSWYPGDEHVFVSATRPTVKLVMKSRFWTTLFDIEKKGDRMQFFTRFLQKGSMAKLSIGDAHFYCKVNRNLTLEVFSELLDTLENISSKSDLIERAKSLKKRFHLRQIKKNKWKDKYNLLFKTPPKRFGGRANMSIRNCPLEHVAMGGRTR